MKKIALIALALLLAVGGYLLFSPTTNKDSNPSKAFVSKEKVESVTQITEDEDELLNDKELLSMDEDFISPKDLDNSTDSEEKGVLLSEIDMEELKTTLPSRKDVEPIMALSIDVDKILELGLGNKIEIPLPNGIYSAEIDYKKINPSVSVSFSGKLVGQTDDYGITLTQGKTSTFVSVNSPDGNFEIEMTQGKGYVYRTKDIQKNIDYSKCDTVELTE